MEKLWTAALEAEAVAGPATAPTASVTSASASVSSYAASSTAQQTAPQGHSRSSKAPTEEFGYNGMWADSLDGRPSEAGISRSIMSASKRSGDVVSAAAAFMSESDHAAGGGGSGLVVLGSGTGSTGGATLLAVPSDNPALRVLLVGRHARGISCATFLEALASEFPRCVIALPTAHRHACSLVSEVWNARGLGFNDFYVFATHSLPRGAA
jgi:hypothetical protein